MLFPEGGLGPLLVLVPHAACEAVRAITARLERANDGLLRVAYALEGDLSRLRIPASRTGDANLWQHTCFEIFIAPSGMPSYHEFNFAPSGDWNAYAFRKYREGGPLADGTLDPRLKIHATETKLALQAEVRLDRLGIAGRLSIGLSAVVEEKDGALSYWALKHAPGKPDFHHRDAFAFISTSGSDEFRH
jgi:hypothetical protein